MRSSPNVFTRPFSSEHPAAGIRRATVAIALLLFALLVIASFSAAPEASGPFPFPGFAIPLVIAVTFFFAGSLIWLFHENRRLARPYYGFCLSFAATFLAQPAAASDITDRTLFSLIAHIASALALALLLLSSLELAREATGHWTTRLERLVSWYGTGTAWFFLLVIVYSIWLFMGRDPLPWMDGLTNAYYLLTLAGALIVLLLASRHAETPFELQRIRLLLVGCVLSFAPLLLFTFLPLVLHAPSSFVLDARYSTLSVVAFPVLISFSLIKYPSILLHRPTRRFVTWFIAVYYLLPLVYVSTQLVLLLQEAGIAGPWILILIPFPLGGISCILWYLSNTLANNLLLLPLAPRFHAQVNRLAGQAQSVEEAALTLQTAVMTWLETSDVCLFVLNTNTGRFELKPALAPEPPRDLHTLARLRLLGALGAGVQHAQHGTEERYWFEGTGPIARYLKEHTECVPLETIYRDAKFQPAEPQSPSPSLSAAGAIYCHPFLIPLFCGHLIGILVMGARLQEVPTAGMIDQLYDLMLTPTTVLAIMLHQEHLRYLNSLYAAFAAHPVKNAGEEGSTLAEHITEVAADVTGARAELWLEDTTNRVLELAAAVGPGRSIAKGTTCPLPEGCAWIPAFEEECGSKDQFATGDCSLYAGILWGIDGPVACLPLASGEDGGGRGILVLSFLEPHLFSEGERWLLTWYAGTWSALLALGRLEAEVTRSTADWERLEQTRRRWRLAVRQHIHSPLLAVQEDLRLLDLAHIPQDLRERLVDRTILNGDRLVLKVEDCLVSARLALELPHEINPTPVALSAALRHCLAMLAAEIRQDERTITLELPDETSLFVLADEVCLRQVLLTVLGVILQATLGGTVVALTAMKTPAQVDVSLLSEHLTGAGCEFLLGRGPAQSADVTSLIHELRVGWSAAEALLQAMQATLQVQPAGRAGDGCMITISFKPAWVRAEVAQARTAEG